MATQIHLANPPIVEAIIEVQVVMPEGDMTPRFLAIHEQFAKEYPTVKEDIAFQAGVELNPQNSSPCKNLPVQSSLRGFHFLSDDGKNIIQVRKDGFSFNRLSPYGSWEEFMEKAEPAWAAYKHEFKEATITRNGIRYINKIDLRLDSTIIELRDYFEMPPPDLSIPGLTYTGFFNRAVLFDADSELKANWILAHQPNTDFNILSIVLDIDVYDDGPRVQELEVKNLWPSMRKLKNNLFFSTFTEKGLNSFNV